MPEWYDMRTAAEAYTVTRAYCPLVGSGEAPGTHYNLESTRTETHEGMQFPHSYSFYRTPRGSEVVADMGWTGTIFFEIGHDTQLYRDLKAVVEAYDVEHGPHNMTNQAYIRRITHWEWTSPNDVVHLVGINGRCETCGRSHSR